MNWKEVTLLLQIIYNDVSAGRKQRINRFLVRIKQSPMLLYTSRREILVKHSKDECFNVRTRPLRCTNIFHSMINEVFVIR